MGVTHSKVSGQANTDPGKVGGEDWDADHVVSGLVATDDADWVDLTDGGETALHSHAGGGSLTLNDVIDALYPVGSLYTSTLSTNPGTLLGRGTWSAFGAGRVMVGRDSGDTDFDTSEETGGAKTKAISAHSGGAVDAHSGTAVGTSGAGSAHSHTGPSHQHTYTDVPNHVHVQSVNSATTGGLSGYTPDTSTNTSTSSGYSTANPTGGVATGTTAAGGTGNTGNESAHTHAAGTVTQPSNHTFTQPSAHTDLNVVQPYIVVFMWKRTA